MTNNKMIQPAQVVIANYQWLLTKHVILNVKQNKQQKSVSKRFLKRLTIQTNGKTQRFDRALVIIKGMIK